MAKIEINPGCALRDGLSVIFKAPCNCDEVDGIVANGTEFSFRDAHGNNLTGIGDLFVAGAVVKALLDTVNGYAYIQNADTNAYLEGKLGEAVKHTAQNLTAEQQAQARANLGIKAETWTFTLIDETTVTKVVYVG